MCGLEPDDSSGNARQLSSSLITSALPRGNCHLFRIHATKPVVTKVAIGDRLHYELKDPDGAHHHMVCQVCNGAYHLSPHYLQEFRDILIREFGFEPDLDNFAITGVCADCRRVDSTQNG